MISTHHNMEETVKIPVDRVELTCQLSLPENAGAIVLFLRDGAHPGEAEYLESFKKHLNEKGIGTLFMMNLLTEEEGNFIINQIDSELLSHRLIAVTEWIHRQLFRGTPKKPKLVYFGSSANVRHAFMASRLIPELVSGIILLCSNSSVPFPQDMIRNHPTKILCMAGKFDSELLSDLEDILEESKNENIRVELLPVVSHIFSDSSIWPLAGKIVLSWINRLH